MTKLNFLGVAGIIIGLLGVVGPIGWDYYKTKSEIELRVIEKSVIISKPKKLDGLMITYAGEALDELSKTTFSLTNSGRTPVLKKDVASPITVKFAKDLNIIDAKIDEMQPRDLGASFQFNRGNGTIVLEFPLLNPGDRINFSVLAKTSTIDFDAGGRIAGVSSLHIIKDIAQDKVSKNVPWTVYPVGFFSAILALFSLVGFIQVPRERRIKAQVMAGTFEIPKFKKLDEGIAWVNSVFDFTIEKERAPLIAFLRALPFEDNFATLHHEKIMVEVKNMLKNAMSNLYLALIILGIASVGGLYIIYNI